MAFFNNIAATAVPGPGPNRGQTFPPHQPVFAGSPFYGTLPQPNFGGGGPNHLGPIPINDERFLPGGGQQQVLGEPAQPQILICESQAEFNALYQHLWPFMASGIIPRDLLPPYAPNTRVLARGAQLQADARRTIY